jgi:predicted transcriptional regulator of viral defense system
MARALTHTAAARELEHLSQQVRGEYLEMPGMSLTVDQAMKMWGVSREICATLLDSLVDAGFLRRSQHGTYLLAAAIKYTRE